MNGRKLQDTLYYGLGVSARRCGEFADAFRSPTSIDPLQQQNRFLRLAAAFLNAKGGANRSNAFGESLWTGIFDASYTRPGDFIVARAATYYIASQEPMQPVLCVRTNRIISVTRPKAQTKLASNAYGGYTANSSQNLIVNWPVSMLSNSRQALNKTNLPTDQPTSFCDILLSAPPQVVFTVGDMITDDLGRMAIISESELTCLGWRLGAKMVAT